MQMWVLFYKITDSFKTSDGMNDNGSGVAAVLEAAEALAEAVKLANCSSRPLNSVIVLKNLIN